MNEKILTLALALGEVDSDQLELLQQMCLAAEQELAGKLMDGLSAEDCEPAFVAAAAWIALAGLYAGQVTDGLDSFTAGELTVKLNGQGRESLRLREQAEQVMAPYLKDKKFAFLGVQG